MPQFGDLVESPVEIQIALDACGRFGFTDGDSDGGVGSDGTTGDGGDADPDAASSNEITVDVTDELGVSLAGATVVFDDGTAPVVVMTDSLGRAVATVAGAVDVHVAYVSAISSRWKNTRWPARRSSAEKTSAPSSATKSQTGGA